MEFILENETELPLIALQLLQYKQKLFVLYGEMGAGKTTLIV
jgi:tRNA A37 threonylcarbamoyladenosine biosynthesis protein TsaE